LNRYLIDAVELGHNPKGISRVLASLVPLVVARATMDEVFVACTVEAREALARVPSDRLVRVHRGLQSRWEQWGLPRLARRVGVGATYSHRESGALWGPPLVLHIPEDPELRWERDPPRSAREHARRAYSRTTMRRAIHRAAVVAASTPTVASALSNRYRIPLSSISIIPLGVDLSLFSPSSAPAAETIFHLGSPDPRDRTLLVVEAWAAAREHIETLPKLVIGGRLGDVAGTVERRACELGVDVALTGRLSDAQLAECLREAAVVVQPSSDEGFGLQPLEAMAAGAPLVVTEAGAVTDVVADAAVVCPPEAGELSHAIVEALVRAPELRGASRRRAAIYTWEASADAVIRSLAQAADGR
jgi:glycosyltransferase involved in cell wall biosynthesis